MRLPKGRVQWDRLASSGVLILAAFLVILGTQSTWAQSGRANIGGTITDSQGSVVDGATVTATNLATGVATPVTTNSSGLYNIIQVISGVYNIKVEKPGFGSQERQNVMLVAEQNLGADFTLRPGTVSERVEVEAGAELVHTESAELSQTINERAIVELPLNGRNPASLVLLTPGTVDLFAGVKGQGHQTYTTFPTETAASSNGGRQGSTLYLLDGAYNMDNYQLAASPFPNPDATQEFSVIGNNFDSRYGFTPGGVVSIVTKSGTNNWHGDAFEFLRNGGFNAADYFTHKTDQVHRNQFGVSLGGPILKDKLFIFGNYQGTRQSIFQAGSNGFMPTADMLGGNFSAYCESGFDGSGLCQDRDSTGTIVQHQIFRANPTGYPDSGVPLATIQDANFPGFYPGNIIPASELSAPALQLAGLITNGLTPQNQFGSIEGTGYSSRTKFDEFTIRADYNLSDHHRISGRAFDNFFNQPAVGGQNAVSTDRSWIVDWQSYAGTWTWTINPRMVNNLTASYTRMFATSGTGINIDGESICFSKFINVADPSSTPCSIEGLDIRGGYQSTGGFPGNWQNFNAVNRTTRGFSDNLSISKGKHLIVAGVDVLKQYWYLNTDWAALPIIGFAGGPQGQFTGHGFSDFLLGDMSSIYQDGGANGIVDAWMIAPYVADQVKLTPRLTLSLGLRWEPWIAPTIASGRISYFVPGKQSTRYPNAPQGMVFPGDAGVPSAGAPSDYGRFFNPRAGLAWQPKALPNTSVRAAFGMYAAPVDYSTWNHVSEMTPFSPAYSFSTGATVTDSQGNPSQIPIIPFADPWSVYSPLGGQNPFPGSFADPGHAPGPEALFFPPITIGSAFDLNYTAGRTYTWNLSLEHQFGTNWVARAAYVGSESDHQSYQNEANPGPPVCGPVGPNCAQITAFPARIYPQFGGVDLSYSGATANYQSGQFTLERRMFHGLQFTANYTYAHNIDIESTGTGINTGYLQNPGCVECNRGNSNISIPQTFVANFVYETPSLAGWNRAAKLALGGWQVSGIYRASSGAPFSILCGCTTSWQYGGQDHPDFADGVTRIHQNPGDLEHYLVASDFVTPQQGSSGSVGRNPGVYTSGVNTWDLGLSKNIRFTERYRLQFRWEMYNAFNRVTFGQPNNTFTSSSFGQITSTNSAYPARVMQGALKFYF
jgi:hypothetical protein